jgi:hypothetical protein
VKRLYATFAYLQNKPSRLVSVLLLLPISFIRLL